MEPSAIERAGMLVSYSRALSLVAADKGAAPAIIDGETSLSFTELDRRSNQLARAYAELGVGQDDFVTLALPNCIEFFVACFAIWKLGATPQPVSHRLPFRERDEIVTLADSKLVIGVPAETHRNRTCIPQGFNPDPDIDDGLLEDRVAASWKAPTSGGSTGRPKLIVSSKPSLAPIARTSAGWAIQGQFHTWGGGNDHGCHILAGPLYHNAPFISALMGILAGCQQVLMQRFEARRWLELVQKHRADYVYMVPTMMKRVWDEPSRKQFDLSSLSAVFHMAAPCPPWLKEGWY